MTTDALARRRSSFLEVIVILTLTARARQLEEKSEYFVVPTK